MRYCGKCGQSLCCGGSHLCLANGGQLIDEDPAETRIIGEPELFGDSSLLSDSTEIPATFDSLEDLALLEDSITAEDERDDEDGDTGGVTPVDVQVWASIDAYFPRQLARNYRWSPDPY